MAISLYMFSFRIVGVLLSCISRISPVVALLSTGLLADSFVDEGMFDSAPIIPIAEVEYSGHPWNAGFTDQHQLDKELTVFSRNSHEISAFLHPLQMNDAETHAEPKIKPWGLNLKARNLSMKPTEDFYQYAAGSYVNSISIPDHCNRWNPFAMLRNKSSVAVHEILKEDTGIVGNYYAAYNDRSAVKSKGLTPLREFLETIKKVHTGSEFATLAGKAFGVGFYKSPFALQIAPDLHNPDTIVLHIGPGGLGITREYYLEDKYAKQKKAYVQFVSTTLHQVSWPDAESWSQQIVDLETQIAKVHWRKAELLDQSKAMSTTTLKALKKVALGFEWEAWLASAGVPLDLSRLNLQAESAVASIAKIINKTSANLLQAWEVFHATWKSSGYLPDEFGDAEFEFSKAFYGTLQRSPLSERAQDATNAALGEAVGKLYVEKHVDPSSKEKIDVLVDALVKAFHAQISRLSWMSSETKEKALLKLDRMRRKIGHPEVWTNYTGLSIRNDDLLGNVKNVNEFKWKAQLRTLGQPPDLNTWYVTPQSVTAGYLVLRNEVQFPAALLQPPLFDPAADPAVNFGAVGALIGHEIIHGFNDRGRHYNHAGKLEDWWTPEDAKKFKQLANLLGKQYAAFEPLPGLKINENLTMGQNIADAGGLRMALEAYHMSLDGKSAPVLDGLTGDQRFFLSWVQARAGKIRRAALEHDLLNDEHSPDIARASIPPRNMEAWYIAFGAGQGDKTYIPPQNRVEIWYTKPNADPLGFQVLFIALSLCGISCVLCAAYNQYPKKDAQLEQSSGGIEVPTLSQQQLINDGSM